MRHWLHTNHILCSLVKVEQTEKLLISLCASDLKKKKKMTKLFMTNIVCQRVQITLFSHYRINRITECSNNSSPPEKFTGAKFLQIQSISTECKIRKYRERDFSRFFRKNRYVGRSLNELRREIYVSNVCKFVQVQFNLERWQKNKSIDDFHRRRSGSKDLVNNRFVSRKLTSSQ